MNNQGTKEVRRNENLELGNYKGENNKDNDMKGC